MIGIKIKQFTETINSMSGSQQHISASVKILEKNIQHRIKCSCLTCVGILWPTSHTHDLPTNLLSKLQEREITLITLITFIIMDINPICATNN